MERRGQARRRKKKDRSAVVIIQKKKLSNRKKNKNSADLRKGNLSEEGLRHGKKKGKGKKSVSRRRRKFSVAGDLFEEI